MGMLRLCIYSWCIIIIVMALLCIWYEIYKYLKRFKKNPNIIFRKVSLEKTTFLYKFVPILIVILLPCFSVWAFRNIEKIADGPVMEESIYSQAIEEVYSNPLVYSDSVSGNRLESYYEDAQFYIDLAIIYYQNILSEDPENVEVEKIIEYLSQIEKIKENELEGKEHSAISINANE